MENRVAIIMDNSEKVLELIIDSWNQDKCVVLIENLLPIENIIKQLKRAKVSECFIDKSMEGKFLCNKLILNFFNENKIKHTFINNNIGYKFICQKIVSKFVSRYDKKDALILFSSGSSGVPRGILLSHFAINTNADNIISYIDLKEEDSVFITKSICHSSTIVGEILVSLKRKVPIYIGAKQVSPLWQIKKIIELRTTILFTNSKLLNLYTSILEKRDIHVENIRKIYSSGSILTNDIKIKANKFFFNAKIYNAYGLTECGPRVCVQDDDKGVSVGYPIKDVSVKLVDFKGNEVRKGDKGEVCVKTPCMFTGYIDEKKIWNPKKWFHTNDIGYIDDQGNINIIGRKDNVVNINGYKIHLESIETIIEEHPQIDEVIVVPINMGNRDCFICLYSGKIVDEALLKIRLSCELATREIPRKFYFVESLPFNTNRKKDRRKAKRIVSNLLRLKGVD